jgi:hypothetical protein
MPRSARSQSLLIGVFVALLVVSVAAFAFTFESRLAWQHRDAVATEVDGVRVVAGEGRPALAVNVTVENPTARAVTLTDVALVVYRGDPPFADDRQLTVPRTASVPRTTVPGGGTATATVTARVEDGAVERARRAVANGTATPSGSLELELLGRGFDTDV